MYTYIQTKFHTFLLSKVYLLHSKIFKYTLVNANKGTFSIPRRHWISNPGVPCSNLLGDSKVHSTFHPSEVDKMSTRNIWKLSGKK